MFIQPVNQVKEIFYSQVCALPPVFAVSFTEAEPKLYLATVETWSAFYFEQGLLLDQPGESAIEMTFEVGRKLNLPYLLSIHSCGSADILVTLNGDLVTTYPEITDLVQEGTNVLRIELLKDAQESFHLMSAAMSIRFNPFQRVDL